MKALTLVTAGCLAVLMLAGSAAGEVTVSVTLTGPIDEILPLLGGAGELRRRLEGGRPCGLG